MGRPTYITLTSTGVATVYLDTFQSPFNVSVGVVLASSSAGTATYGVTFSLDDPQYLVNNNSTRTPFFLPDANLPAGQTASGTTNYMFPVAAVQLTVTALSSTSIIFQVLQGGAP
jgi:hypothetical protein